LDRSYRGGALIVGERGPHRSPIEAGPLFSALDIGHTKPA
jgi:hypothetical protein